MDPIQGIGQTSNIPLISPNAGNNRDNIDMASAKLALDAQKTIGQELVKMMENLGKVIDTYA